MREALARYNNQGRATRRRADLTATIVLLVVHGMLACGTALALFVSVDTDACALFHCADQPFFSAAFGAAVPAAGLVFAADLAVAVRRITRRKTRVRRAADRVRCADRPGFGDLHDDQRSGAGLVRFYTVSGGRALRGTRAWLVPATDGNSSPGAK